MKDISSASLVDLLKEDSFPGTARISGGVQVWKGHPFAGGATRTGLILSHSGDEIYLLPKTDDPSIIQLQFSELQVSYEHQGLYFSVDHDNVFFAPSAGSRPYDSILAQIYLGGSESLRAHLLITPRKVVF